MLRTTVRRQYILVLSTRLGHKTSFFYCQLRIYWCGTLSLVRGRVCRLQLPVSLASAVILGSESRGTVYFSLRGPGTRTWNRVAQFCR
jgi:hypothetical protein